ncbi:uncharacterized protein orion isoform X3 [Neodiprion pinetum]|uniref:Uncharacterized protein LOC107224674 isoform X2 n=2 Tax=Neodiprion TaxID=270857 RepID=A0A6J0C1B3_NEOLC|nr:uncharacterized protein LOC107224674 isoform X3 [Neodiprion lecontei]XP_015520322.1 uncharacterized protein LOC107224674 isoform X3 [Neodiprion lecontei]XP_046483076.1 uncharacterized protein LOC124219496 isoform X3 [Neodiprion pinetum]XP_046483077.1 uncharacterized protein LOC124219496 isoform X3 [Neodiprion pinetum]XP_046483078.1 uncharacterized protein LOC124219496 isoform X3 [Neodiprion pinetum]XP_046596573.1 uncharacterized protein LOC107224674 isoform X3 [Neodiprion lecontei]XP_04659
MILTIAKMDGYFKFFFLLSLITAVTAIENGIQLSKVDVIRHDLMKVESDLVQRLNIPSTMYDSDMRKKSVAMIIEAYAKFGIIFDDEFPNTREKHLEPLQSLHIWARAENILRNIDGLYTTFRRLQQASIESHLPVDEETWKDFSETILFDANASILTALYQVFDLIVDEKLYASAYQEGERTICNDNQSPQQLLYNLYNSIAVTEIKGYTMMQFSWLLLKLYKNGNFTEEIRLTKSRYEARMAETSQAIQTAMAFASPDLWKCDPQHRGPETSTELNWFLQSYVVHELDLNEKNTCGQNCAYYSYAEVNCNPKDAYCKKQRKCNGAVYNCQFIDSDMWICPAETSSNRRYNYIEYENGRVLGEKGTCSQGTTKVDSWWRWLFWHCSYCVCSCDQQDRDSDRFFNLRKVVADVESNKVITGIKFVKVNKMIHIQIEQGQLLGSGTISNVTEWKPVESYSIYSDGVIEGTDFLTLSWHQRAIDLDDLKAPPGHLLTGVKFRKLGAHINLEIMTTPFNFTTGILIKPDTQSIWHGNDNTDATWENPRTLLKLDRPDKSTRSQAASIPDSKHDQYMMFSPSDLDKDAGQSTVPFIDTQPVAPYPRVPIAGAGIYHKGRPGFGGYIAPKLKTYNFAPHLHFEHFVFTPLINNKSNNVITLPHIN